MIKDCTIIVIKDIIMFPQSQIYIVIGHKKCDHTRTHIYIFRSFFLKRNHFIWVCLFLSHILKQSYPSWNSPSLSHSDSAQPQWHWPFPCHHTPHPPSSFPKWYRSFSIQDSGGFSYQANSRDPRKSPSLGNSEEI